MKKLLFLVLTITMLTCTCTYASSNNVSNYFDLLMYLDNEIIEICTTQQEKEALKSLEELLSPYLPEENSFEHLYRMYSSIEPTDKSKDHDIFVYFHKMSIYSTNYYIRNLLDDSISNRLENLENGNVSQKNIELEVNNIVKTYKLQDFVLPNDLINLVKSGDIKEFDMYEKSDRYFSFKNVKYQFDRMPTKLLDETTDLDYAFKKLINYLNTDNVESNTLVDAYTNPKKYGFTSGTDAIEKLLLDSMKKDYYEENFTTVSNRIKRDIKNYTQEKQINSITSIYANYLPSTYNFADTMEDSLQAILDYSSNETENLNSIAKEFLNINVSPAKSKDSVKEIIKQCTTTTPSVMKFKDFSSKSRIKIEDIIYDGLTDVFIDYRMKAKYDYSNILNMYYTYKENGFDSFRDSVHPMINYELFKNCALVSDIEDCIHVCGYADIPNLLNKISDNFDDKAFKSNFNSDTLKTLLLDVKDDKVAVDITSKYIIETIINIKKDDIDKTLDRTYKELQEYISNSNPDEISTNIYLILGKQSYFLPCIIDNYEVYSYCLQNKNKSTLADDIYNKFFKPLQVLSNENVKKSISSDLDNLDTTTFLTSNTLCEELNYSLSNYSLNNYVPVRKLQLVLTNYKDYGYTSTDEVIDLYVKNALASKITSKLVLLLNEDISKKGAYYIIDKVLASNYISDMFVTKTIYDYYKQPEKHNFATSYDAIYNLLASGLK